MAHDPSGSGRSDPYTDGDDRKEHHEAAFDLRGHADLLRGGSELGGFALQTSARMLAEEGGVAPGATRGGDETFDVADAMPLMRSVPSAPVATLPAMSMMRAAPVYRDAGAAVHPGHGMLSHMGDHMGDHLGDHLDSSMLRGSAPSFGKGMPDLAAMMPSSDAATKLHERLLDDESVISPPFLPPPPYPLERHTYAVPCERGMAAVHVVRGLKRALGECKIDAEFVEGECRWECNVVSSGQRSTFHLRLHSVEAGFCLEFQRRKGCSIVFNVAVRGVLDHLSNTHFGGKQLPLFKRSEKDKQVPRTAGFYIASFDIPDVPLDLGVPLDFTSGGLLGSDHEAGAKDEALLLELADADKHEDVDSVMALVDMANAPEGGHVAVEGTTGLAILSHGEGREALLEAGHVEEVVRAAAKGLASKDLCQRCAAATLVADLTEDERGHDAVVSTGCLDKVLETARAPHNPSNAHVRRECLRALLQLAQGKHRGAVASKGGAECVKKVAACCSDARMADTARLAVQYLQ